MPDKVEIRPSLINGEGIFAKKNFSPGEIIIRWSDEVRLAVYLNHSCRPTAYTEEPVANSWQEDVLKAGRRGISARQEITFDYRGTRWAGLWSRTVKKSCGCPRCRKARKNKLRA